MCRVPPLCPNCNQSLVRLRIRREFSCPSCHAPLVSNSDSRVLTAFIAWVVLDLPILLVGRAAAGDSMALYVAYYALPSAALGLAVLWLALSGVKVRQKAPLE